MQFVLPICMQVSINVFRSSFRRMNVFHKEQLKPATVNKSPGFDEMEDFSRFALNSYMLCLRN